MVVDAWVAASFLFVTAFGGSVGTGALVLWLNANYQAREGELRDEIAELTTRYNELVNLMVRERVISAGDAARVKKSTGPLRGVNIEVGGDATIGGDVVGRDKAG